jgi:glycosyltransferase involved in cell wall biosynthesis
MSADNPMPRGMDEVTLDDPKDLPWLERARTALAVTWSAFSHARMIAPYWPALRSGRSCRARDLAGRRDVVMVVISNLHIDPRVERAARAVAASGFNVKVMYPDAYPPHYDGQPIDWGPGVEFLPLSKDAGGFIFTKPWLFGQEMHEALQRERPFAIHCHDLTTVLVGMSAARQTGAFCLCDFHEWYSENVSWVPEISGWGAHPPTKRMTYRLAERLALWRGDAVITVCDSIADELSAMHPGGRHVDVIRNIPPLAGSGKSYPSLKEELGIPEDRFLLLWQGGTGPSRLLEPIIRALALMPNVTFVIRGPSLEYFGAAYQELAEQVGAADRLVLLPPVPSAEVIDAAVGADAGIWTLPKLSKNFYYALPNKIFEYMASGLPVLAADFPEARKMVRDNGVGLCFDPYDPASIARQVSRLAEEPGLAERCRLEIPRALVRINADKEWDKLVDVYRRLRDSA